MNTSSESALATAIDRQLTLFLSGTTLPLQHRREALLRLRNSIVQHETDIITALQADLHKAAFEAYTTEIGMVLGEIGHLLHMGKRMVKPQRVARNLFTINARSRILYEPYGQTLIVSPWNYPFHLALLPVAGAIASGNVVVLKVSPSAPATNRVMRTIISEAFPNEEVLLVEGHRDVNTWLFARRWNHIFLTGSPELGKVAMASAAQHLTPVTLELGGKSPCIVDETADIDLAARRITYGKLVNAGQTCIAPDYLLVHPSVKQPLVEAMKHYATQFYGNDLLTSEQYPHIITDEAMTRLVSYVEENRSRIIFGGRYDRDTRAMELTLIDGMTGALEHREIFGPIMPVCTFDHIDEVIELLQQREKPLALYYFSTDKQRIRHLLRRTTSGGACINETLMHVTNSHVPFGGVENSGLGGYHGKYSFEAFSHKRAVLHYGRTDFLFKYPPYTSRWMKLVKRIMK